MSSLATLSTVPVAPFGSSSPRTSALGPLPSSPSFPHGHKGPFLHQTLHLWRTNTTTGVIRRLCVKSNAGEFSDDGRRFIDAALGSARKVFERLPEPVKRFPWSGVGAAYVNILFDLLVSLAKYLAVPLLVVSSLSEMSYCAHQRKLAVVPVPFVAGAAVAGALRQTFKYLSTDRKDEEFPWDVVLMAIFFLVLKFPGPYYPYLGRLIIPHFANGGLWSVLWFGFQWLRKMP